MKTIKKLSVAIVALAMCLLLGISVWAANESGVTYSAELGKSTLCITGAAQTLEVTVKAGKEVELDSFTAYVELPDGWTLDSVTGPDSNLFFSEETGMIMWFNLDAVNSKITTIFTMTVTVPANVTADDYEIGIDLIDLSSDHGTVWEADASVPVKVTVAEHSYKTTTVNNGADHTATEACEYCGDVKSSETVAHTYDQENGTKCACGAEKPATGLKGDVDLDGEVGPSDLTALARHLAEIEFITDATALYNADVTNDDEVGPDDLTKIAQFMAEIIDSLD